jgi:hypothetical protein
MHLRAKVMLGAMIATFIAAMFLVLLPVSASTPHNSSHIACGSVVSNFKHQAFNASQDACDGAIGRRSSLVLRLGIAGLVLGFVDSMRAFAANRRRTTDLAATTADEVAPTDDLERLLRLYDDGELDEPAFAAHRAGVLLRAKFPPCWRET